MNLPRWVVFASLLATGCAREGERLAPPATAPSPTVPPVPTSVTSAPSTTTTLPSSSATPSSSALVGATPAAASELIALLEKIDKQSPAVFEWTTEKIIKEIGPENRIKILPRLGGGRDIELQVRTGEPKEKPIRTRDLAAALGVADPKVHQLPVTGGPVYRLANGAVDELRFKGLQFEVDISAGDAKPPSGIDLRGKGNFFELSAASDVKYVMILAPEAKK